MRVSSHGQLKKERTGKVSTLSGMSEIVINFQNILRNKFE